LFQARTINKTLTKFEILVDECNYCIWLRLIYAFLKYQLYLTPSVPVYKIFALQNPKWTVIYATPYLARQLGEIYSNPKEISESSS